MVVAHGIVLSYVEAGRLEAYELQNGHKFNYCCIRDKMQNTILNFPPLVTKSATRYFRLPPC